MSAQKPVDVLEVIRNAKTRVGPCRPDGDKFDTAAWDELEAAEKELIERRARDAAVERLIAADVEYDKCFRRYSNSGVDPEANRDFFQAASERAAALAAVRGGAK